MRIVTQPYYFYGVFAWPPWFTRLQAFPAVRRQSPQTALSMPHMESHGPPSNYDRPRFNRKHSFNTRESFRLQHQRGSTSLFRRNTNGFEDLILLFLFEREARWCGVFSEETMMKSKRAGRRRNANASINLKLVSFRTCRDSTRVFLPLLPLPKQSESLAR